MKKLISILLTLALVFSFAACSSDGGEKNQKDQLFHGTPPFFLL